MPKIIVKLPIDRTQTGTIALIDDVGRTIAGPFPALGKSTDRLAVEAQNPQRDPTMENGDTPLGDYAVGGFVKTGTGKYPALSYGSVGAVHLEPISGQALQAKNNGRTGLMIHAGRPKPDGHLVATLGCVRVHEEAMTELLAAIITAGSPPDSCSFLTATIQEITGQAAPDSFDLTGESDPPPAPGNDILHMPPTATNDSGKEGKEGKDGKDAKEGKDGKEDTDGKEGEKDGKEDSDGKEGLDVIGLEWLDVIKHKLQRGGWDELAI